MTTSRSTTSHCWRRAVIARSGALALSVAAMLALQGAASAAGRLRGHDDARHGDRRDQPHRQPGKGFGAPEIEPSLAASGLILIVGGTLVLTHSRKKPAV